MYLSARRLLACTVAALISSASAQSGPRIISYVPENPRAGGVSYAVNIPASTAQSGSGSIYVQMVAPAGTQWLAIGQGKRMAGANFLMIYSSSKDHVTLSSRLGYGDFDPVVNPAARVSLLDGSGISSDGVMTANIRCDSCISWKSGSMDPTSSESGWSWAMKHGDALNSLDAGKELDQHDAHGSFQLDLPSGTSSDSVNPFIQAGAVRENTGSSQSASSSESSSNESTIRTAHGVIISVVFILLLPLGALTIHLPFKHKLLFVHFPLQLLSTALLVAGLALGVALGMQIGSVDEFHQIIGYVVVGILVLFQPILGLVQHLRYRKVAKTTIFGYLHRWIGRIAILVGIINGGLGFHISGGIGSEDVHTWSIIAYSVIAALMVTIYVAVLIGVKLLRRRKPDSERQEKGSQ